MEWEDEEAWLRGRIIRLRTILRYAKDPQVETGLKEFIGDAETRLDSKDGGCGLSTPMTHRGDSAPTRPDKKMSPANATGLKRKTKFKDWSVSRGTTSRNRKSAD